MKTPRVNIEVSLDEFTDKEIIDYASNELGMFEDLEDVETCLLIEELQERGCCWFRDL